MRSELGILLACACLGACSGEADGSNTGNGGAANTTGGAASATGGVGGAIPPAAAVGLSLNLAQTASCPILPGVPDDIGAPPPDSAGVGMGRRNYDGEAGVSVSCSVTASTDGSFRVMGAIASTDPRVAVSIIGNVDATGAGTAVIGLSARALPADVLSPTGAPCTLTVVPNGGLAVKAGAIWARFSCPTLVSAPTYNCSAMGELVLENCAK